MTSVEKCRANGWVVGDHLAGDEGRGDEIIRITAIGEQCIIANRVHPRPLPEGMWNLSHREWRKVTYPPEPPITDAERMAAITSAPFFRLALIAGKWSVWANVVTFDSHATADSAIDAFVRWKRGQGK
jgi:hypothetical protein